MDSNRHIIKIYFFVKTERIHFIQNTNNFKLECNWFCKDINWWKYKNLITFKFYNDLKNINVIIKLPIEVGLCTISIQTYRNKFLIKTANMHLYFTVNIFHVNSSIVKCDC